MHVQPADVRFNVCLHGKVLASGFTDRNKAHAWAHDHGLKEALYAVEGYVKRLR